VFANGAPGDDTGAAHINMRLGKTLSCAAMCTLSDCSRNINGEYTAQFARNGVAVKVIVRM
jgi:hypothetical protein